MLTMTTPNEVKEVIKYLANHKAPGHDNITPQMAKNLPIKWIVFLAGVFNAALHLCYYPKVWKHAIIIPIPKKSAKSPEDLRPISLLSTIGKIYERIILRRLQMYLDNSNFIIPQQFGFRRGHSTTHQLIAVLDYIQIRRSHKEVIRAIHQMATRKMTDVAKSNGMTTEQLQSMLSLIGWALKGTEDIILDVYKGINHAKEHQILKEKPYINATAKPNVTKPIPLTKKQQTKPAPKNFTTAYESHVLINKKADPSILNSSDVAASLNGKGRLVIHTRTTQGASTLAARFKANKNIPNSLKCTERPIIHPRFCLFGVESCTTNNMILESLQNNEDLKNLSGTRMFKIAHCPKDNPHGYTTVFLEDSSYGTKKVSPYNNVTAAAALATALQLALLSNPSASSVARSAMRVTLAQTLLQNAIIAARRPERSFKVLQANLRKSPSAVLELSSIAAEQRIDAILLQELPKNFKWPDSNFVTFIHNDNYTPAGLVIRADLNPIPFSSNDPNIVTALIRLGSQAVVIASAYWHNSASENTFLPTLEHTLNRTPFPCILGMDANAHSPTWGSGAVRDTRGASLEASASLMGLHFLGGPTPYTWSNGALRSSIDVTLASSSLAIHATRVCLQEMAFSDHLPILTNFSNILPSEPTSSWVESSCLEAAFAAFLGNTLHHLASRLQTALTPGDIDEAVILLTTCLQEACDASMKKKSKSPRPSKPWWNKELSKLRNIVVALRRCSQNTFFPTRSFFKGLYRACHNKLKAAIRRAKRLSWISLCQEVSSAAWSSIHRYISKGRRGSLGPPLLKYKDGTLLTSEETCREVLQNYFPTYWTVPRPTVDWLPTFNQEPAFTAAEIFRAIRRCGWRKSPGPDRLGVRCILIGGPALHELLSQIFTKCLRLGHFPTPWKAGLLVLIPKQNSTSSNPLDKYRPFTMINTLAKVFERCILARLQWLADQHGWFSPIQFGFVPGRSAEGALDSINNFINDGLKHWRKTVAISLDISHAFDTVQRHTIIQGLRDLNCPEELIQLSSSSLRGRKVIYQAWDSTLTAHTVLGVAQGAPLSPFFFNIVARKALSLPKPQICQIICFADDFTLLFRAFRRLPTKEINKFLKTVSLWGKGHGLTFNLKKTQACLFHCKSKRPSYQNIKFLDQPILINNHIKILGITFDTTRTFVRHSDNIFNKCKWMLPRLISTIREQYGLTYSSGLKIIKMVILPALLYGSGVWGKRVFETNGTRKLRSLHYKFAKIIIRGGPCTPTIPAISLTGGPPLDISIKAHLAYKEAIKNGPFETRPRPSAVHYPPLRKLLQFSKSLPENATIIYTDGSRSLKGVGGAVFLPPPSTPIQLKLHDLCTSFQAELLAILYSTRAIQLMQRQPTAIASDCLAALHAICNPELPKTSLIAEIVRNLNHLNVQLCWVRGHSGIEGNEHADKLAKAAAESSLPISYSTLSKKFVRARSEQYSHQLWKELYVTDHSTRNLRRIAAFPNTLMAILPKIKFCGTTSTILTGHGFVKADAAKLSRDDPTCPHCHEEDQTVDHLLFGCPAYHLHRFQTATLLGINIFAPEHLQNIPKHKSAWRHLINWMSAATIRREV
ncbi:hypothetical protein LAZ67_11001116 [Cordylochernes scorpioides]|uniref:Reverse transcriptase n=1 Tax=Cordylochernes scorpioides TaxID=51811 RepID=A0ABY6L349_9ARAC|nr:hypothetical protein LAZ67_11001116 [Cordylochernes scorpioides]